MSDDDVPIAVVFVIFAAFALAIPPQSDTFYHLRSGQAMVDARSFLDRELFSHTAHGRPLHNHWWLSQLAFYGLYSLGGPVLLTVAVGTCAFLAVALSWRLTRGSMEARFLALFAFMLVLPQWALRPQVFSMLLLMISIRAVLANRLIWVLPILLVWANLHAMVVMGVALVAAVALEALVWSRERRRESLIVAAAAVVVPMLSPLGYHYWPRVLETVRESRLLQISEYRSAFSATPDALLFWILLTALIVPVACGARSLGARERTDRLLLITAGLFSVAALMSLRNAGMFALVAVPALTRFIPTDAPRRRRPASRGSLVLLVLVAVLAFGFVLHRWRDGGRHAGWAPLTPAAITAVRRCPAPIYNSFNEGGTLMWFVPEQRVFVDGRVEAYPPAFLQRVTKAELAGDYREMFAEYGIKCAVLRTGTAMAQTLGADDAMAVQFADDQWVVLAVEHGPPDQL